MKLKVYPPFGYWNQDLSVSSKIPLSMRTILEVHVNIPIEKIVTQNIVSSLSFFLIIMLVIIINTDTIINSIEIITCSVG